MSRTICAVPVRLSSIALSKLLKLVWCDEWKQKYTCLCKERSETKVLFTILLWVFAGRHMVFFSLNRRSHRESGIACCWNLPKLLLRSRHLLRLQNCQKRKSYSVKRVFRLVWRPAFHGHFGAFGVVYVHTSKLAAKGFVCCFVLVVVLSLRWHRVVNKGSMTWRNKFPGGDETTAPPQELAHARAPPLCQQCVKGSHKKLDDELALVDHMSYYNEAKSQLVSMKSFEFHWVICYSLFLLSRDDLTLLGSLSPHLQLPEQ